jgi:hypothetical protein
MGAAKCRRKALGSAYGASPSWAWHYTIGRKIPLILRDGALRDAWMEDNPTDVSVLLPRSIWFTTAETIDPTSVTALSLRKAYGSNQELFKCLAGGAWRIGYSLPNPSIITFEEALAIHPPGTTYGKWCRRLDHCGVNRRNWRLSFGSLPIVGCRIEEQKEGAWVPHAIDALPLDANAPGYGIPGRMIEVGSDQV